MKLEFGIICFKFQGYFFYCHLNKETLENFYIMLIKSALLHMNDKRIMHRDLKPANIFISADG